MVWAVLHLSDYYTSLFVARLYAASASHTIEFEGGIELTPRFRQDIASLRLVSPRFLITLGLVLSTLALVWLVCVEFLGLAMPFVSLSGGLILLEAAVYARHLREPGGLPQAARYSSIDRPDRPSLMALPRDVGGRIRRLCFDLRLVFLACRRMVGSGGAVFCGSVALRHWQWSRRERRTEVQVTEPDRSEPTAW